MTATPLGRLALYGGGGHGLVVAEAAAVAGWQVVGFIDDNLPVGQAVGSWSVVPMNIIGPGVGVIVAIGENIVRGRIGHRLVTQGHKLETVIHPSAWVSPSAKVGRGVFIGAHAVVNARAHLGDGVIVNSAAVVEHHCHLGDYAHVGPNAALGGNVRLGNHSLIGVGAAVRPGVSIADRCTIGVGAAVVSDIPPGQTVVGVPAKTRP